jgi:hypothetical protein
MRPTLTTLLLCALFLALTANALAEFKAGAAVVDVTPEKLPVLRCPSLLDRGMGTRESILLQGH